ncbi:hypothetical protein ES319_A07G147100v1, partial [Gossypium barbadense]
HSQPVLLFLSPDSLFFLNSLFFLSLSQPKPFHPICKPETLIFPQIIVSPKPQNFPKSNPFAVSLSLFDRQQAERLGDFILKSNPIESYLWRVHQIKLVKNSGFTSAASPSVVLCIVIGSPLLHLHRHPSSTSPSASLCCFSSFLPSNLLRFNPY